MLENHLARGASNHSSRWRWNRAFGSREPWRSISLNQRLLTQSSQQFLRSRYCYHILSPMFDEVQHPRETSRALKRTVSCSQVFLGGFAASRLVLQSFRSVSTALSLPRKLKIRPLLKERASWKKEECFRSNALVLADVCDSHEVTSTGNKRVYPRGK